MKKSFKPSKISEVKKAVPCTENQRAPRSHQQADDLYATLLDINADENIPIQPIAGERSKEDHGDQAQAEATKRIGEMCRETGWVSGKWIWRMNKEEEVDRLWKQLAPSVVDGPLSKAGVCAAKVSLEKEQYLFSLFVKDAFDVPSCTTTLEALVSLYGIIPTGVKTDAFTCAGIDSRHPSRIDTLVLRPKDIEGGFAKVKQLKAEFDQHEAIFGPGSRANDELVPLEDAAIDLADLDADEPPIKTTGQELITPPQAPSLQVGETSQTAPGAPKKRSWVETLTPSTSTQFAISYESPLKLMRHVDYDHLKSQPPSTPRRQPLVTFQDTSPTPLSSEVSSILRTPVTASGLMRHYDLGLSSPSYARRDGRSPIDRSKPLIQLDERRGVAAICPSVTAATQQSGLKAQSIEARLIKRSRLMRL